MTYSGINFRGSSTYVSDPSGFTYALLSDTYNVTRGGLSFGYSGSAAFEQDVSTSVDARLAGSATFNTYNIRFRIDIANGLYNFQAAVGHQTVGVANALYLWDGDFRDTVNNVTLNTTNVIDYPASGTAVAVGKYVVRVGKLYRASAAGTTANNPPTGTSTTTDGTVTWTYIRSALHTIVGNTAAGQVLDAAGAVYSNANWPANQSASAALAVTAGFVTLTCGETAAFVRSIAWQDALPANVGAPAISGTAVVGRTLTVSNGTWTGSPTSYSYQWKRGGSNISGATNASYAVQDADAANGVAGVTCTVTASNAGGSASASSANQPCRRTEQGVGYRYGKQTPATNGTNRKWGSVQLKSIPVSAGHMLLGTGATSPSTWALDSVTTGTSAHWDGAVVGDGRTPCRASGQTLVAGTYVLRMKAIFPDSSIEYQDLTVTVVNGVATLGDYDCWNNSTYDFALGTLFFQQAETDGAQIVELATGWEGPNWPLYLKGCDDHSARMTIRYADATRLTQLCTVCLIGSKKLKLESLRTTNISGAVGSGLGTARLYFSDLSGTYAEDIIIDDFSHIGTTSGKTGTGSGVEGIKILAATNLQFTGLTHIVDCENGLKTGDCTSSTIERLVVERYRDNGAILGGDSVAAGRVVNGLTINDLTCIRALRTSDTHIDGLQFHDNWNGGYLIVKRMIQGMAGGYAFPQGVFGGINGAFNVISGTKNPDYNNPKPSAAPGNNTVHAAIVANRGATGFSLSRNASSHVGSVSVIRHNGNDHMADSYGDQDDTAVSYGPFINLSCDDSTTSGTNTIDNLIAQNGVTVGYGWSSPSFQQDYMRDDGDAAGDMDDDFYHGDPTAYCEDLSPDDWEVLSWQDVEARYKQAHRPTVSGPLDGKSPISATTGDWRTDILAL